MAFVANRITVDPAQCGGRPCVRGMGIRVTDVLDLLVAGLTGAWVLDEPPRPAPVVCTIPATPRLVEPLGCPDAWVGRSMPQPCEAELDEFGLRRIRHDSPTLG